MTNQQSGPVSAAADSALSSRTHNSLPPPHTPSPPAWPCSFITPHLTHSLRPPHSPSPHPHREVCSSPRPLLHVHRLEARLDEGLDDCRSEGHTAFTFGHLGGDACV